MLVELAVVFVVSGQSVTEGDWEGGDRVEWGLLHQTPAIVPLSRLASELFVQ